MTRLREVQVDVKSPLRGPFCRSIHIISGTPMRTPFTFRWAILTLVLFAASTPGPGPLSGQIPAPLGSAPRLGIGYIANAPDLMGGVGGYVVFPVAGGIGLYADVKFNIDDPEDDLAFRPGLTVAQAEAEMEGLRYLTGESSWSSFNAAVLRPLNPSLMAYAGAGYARSTHYRFYEQVVFEIGQAVVVEDPDGGEAGVNVLAGFIFRLTSVVSSHLGFETRPRGITAGLSLRLPPT